MASSSTEQLTFPTSVHDPEAPDTLADCDLTDEEKAAYTRTFLSYDDTVEANKPEDFPYEGDGLLELTKYTYLRIFVSKDHSVLSDDFTFKGASIGPIGRDDFMETFEKYHLHDAFPEYTTAIHNMQIDPHQPNRVFWSQVFEGVHTGPGLDNLKPTGKTVRSAPQVCSFTFNNDGKVTHMTAGYVIDRSVGNTGGLGALLGILYAIGKPLPIPEGHPYEPSWQFRMMNFVGGIAKNFGGKKKTDKKKVSNEDAAEADAQVDTEE